MPNGLPTPTDQPLGLLTVLPSVPIGNIGVGVWGYFGLPSGAPTQHSTAPISCAVYGEGGIVGAHGLQPSSDKLNPSGDGVIGFGAGTGVHGVSTGGGIGARGVSDTGSGVSGLTTDPKTGTGVDGTGALYGVRGICTGPSDATNPPAGVMGQATGGALAGLFYGDVTISGDIKAVNTINVNTDVVLSGGDCAEQFDMHEERVPEPGTTVVIDDDGKLRESKDPYDKRVAGVISGAGEFRPALILDRRLDSKGRASVALVGKVYCKVDANYAPINVGDLLTTSDRPGFAMKATDPGKAFGAVIGKALKPHPTGIGMIPILVALQ
jgi:hypothetical protein